MVQLVAGSNAVAPTNYFKGLVKMNNPLIFTIKMKKSIFLFSFIFLLSPLFACYFFSVTGEFFLTPGFQPPQFRQLIVLNLDPQIHFAEYVEAELVKKGYEVKEEALARQMLKKEGILKDGSFSLEELKKIGQILKVQGVVFCRVLDFSRFRDYYRLQIKMVSAETGNTIWVAQGSMEGKRGEKPSAILGKIVSTSLRDLPSVH